MPVKRPVTTLQIPGSPKHRLDVRSGIPFHCCAESGCMVLLYLTNSLILNLFEMFHRTGFLQLLPTLLLTLP
jgi:hypothetical protein